ncbi:phosphatidylserine decarboxylase [Oribacterium sp. WCC10]|uniref:phosphatidylserine decarboxylase n=1 Tax=Oribacterium sp. WCC10 TaxID=1855343 RepID=UPI0008E75FF3|nr:phosphatidylserine decarboxylase [Oribacterium sp. WCC10]SFG20743.1 phosphatidylserine decarboxylase [Oribacterium sp. WCC10]
MSESLMIDFLYGTPCGRFLLKGLVNRKVSVCAAELMSSGLSAHIVPSFIKNNGINPDDYEVPEGGYKSFNDFFTRKIKPGRRIIEDGLLTSPCDAYLTVSDIDENSIFHIKHTSYSLNQLLKDKDLAGQFMGGSALIFRLTPSHYHRYSFCVSGDVRLSRRIDGILHSVKPVCHEKYPVFIQNSREFVVLNNKDLGDIVQMEIGALLVGKISNSDYRTGDMVQKGSEKGYFEYGGSSIVVLTKRRLPEIKDEISVELGKALIQR